MSFYRSLRFFSLLIAYMHLLNKCSATESRPGGISIFDVKNGEHQYKICAALGHLYGLTDVAKNRSVYPVLDLEWSPVAENPRVVRAIKVIYELAKDASSFVHACDYDQEGEVIG